MTASTTALVASPALCAGDLRAVKRRLVSMFERAEIDTVTIEKRWLAAMRSIDAAVACASYGAKPETVNGFVSAAAAELREIPAGPVLTPFTAAEYVRRMMTDYNAVTVENIELDRDAERTVYIVSGTYRDVGETGKYIRSFCRGVWLETNGEIYGEIYGEW